MSSIRGPVIKNQCTDRVYQLTLKSSSQSGGGLQDEQYDMGHLSNETGTNLKLAQRVRE